MQGQTGAQIRQAFVAAMQAAASITGTVPAARIYDGRMLAIQDDTEIPCIRVYVHQDNFDWSGDSQTPYFSGQVDLVVELYVTALTDAALETSLDFADTITNVCFSDVTLTRAQIARTTQSRTLGTQGDRRLGLAKSIWTIQVERLYP